MYTDVAENLVTAVRDSLAEQLTKIGKQLHAHELTRDQMLKVSKRCGTLHYDVDQFVDGITSIVKQVTNGSLHS